MEFSKEGTGNRSIGVLGNKPTESKEARLSGIERMKALLWEVKSIASRESQQYEELRQMGEARVGLLEAQLRENKKRLHTKESAIRQLEESLTAKVQELEHRLTETEDLTALLEKRNAEIASLRSETETRVGLLEAQLRENEKRLNTKESAIRQLEESLTAKVQELEHRLTEKEDLTGLLEKRNAEIASLRSETETRVGLLEAQLQENKKRLHTKESAIRQLDESLTVELKDLEAQLSEKGALLEVRQADLNDLRSKLDTPGNTPEGMVTLNLLDSKGEKCTYPPNVQEEMTENLKGMAVEAERLRAQIQERDAMLAEKETELKMITRSMEEEVSRHLPEKEESLGPREFAAKQQEDTLTARIHDLENRVREKEAQIEEEQRKDLQHNMSAELERLRAELRDRNLLLEARETEDRMIKQSVQEKFRGLERMMQRPLGGEARKSRLVSFPATIEKKN